MLCRATWGSTKVTGGRERKRERNTQAGASTVVFVGRSRQGMVGRF